jgi:hypothetical protein
MIVGAVVIGILGGLASGIATLLLGGTLLQAFVVYSVGGSAVVVLSALLMTTSSLGKKCDTAHGKHSSASLEA